MSKKKSVVVTTFVMALIGAITALLLAFMQKGLVVFGGLFAVYGCMKFAEVFSA